MSNTAELDSNDISKRENNIFVSSCVLPSNLNREVVIRFLNKFHRTDYGNTTLITIKNYNIFTKLGTICSYLTKGNVMIGVLFSVIVTLNVGRSTYTTYLCIRPDFRKIGLARPLIGSTINFGVHHLGVKHGYYLVNKIRRKGCRIHSYYRILDRESMMESGFTMLEKCKYSTELPSNIKVRKGLHSEDYIDKLAQVHWSPDEEELKRYKETLDFYTIYQNDVASAVFILTPLQCIIHNTGKRVNIAMLTYYHSISGDEDRNMKGVIYQARKGEYECLYGYILGDITREIIIKNEGHITDAILYLDFFNHPYNVIEPSSINIPLF